MTKYQRRCYEMFVRARGFGQMHSWSFPDSSPGARAVEDVANCVAEIDALLVRQVLDVDDPRWRARQRMAITRALLSIARGARRIARDEPMIAGKFTMPPRRTDGALLETARLFERDATPLEQRFVDVGIPAAFLTDLRSRIDVFDRAIRLQCGARAAATAGHSRLAHVFKRGFDAVLTLDIVVANVHPQDDVMRGTWRSARRVERKRVRQKKQKPQKAA